MVQIDVSSHQWCPYCMAPPIACAGRARYALVCSACPRLPCYFAPLHLTSTHCHTRGHIHTQSRVASHMVTHTRPHTRGQLCCWALPSPAGDLTRTSGVPWFIPGSNYCVLHPLAAWNVRPPCPIFGHRTHRTPSAPSHAGKRGHAPCLIFGHHTQASYEGGIL